MTDFLTLEDLVKGRSGLTIIDVRKPKALKLSGLCLPQSRWHHPFDAANWAGRYLQASVLVYCVHGHEVSQAVAGFLRDEGMDASYLEGGFEAWRNAGHPVVKQDGSDA